MLSQRKSAEKEPCVSYGLQLVCNAAGAHFREQYIVVNQLTPARFSLLSPRRHAARSEPAGLILRRRFIAP